jgi:predicted nucleic acid-binding protein
VILYLDTSHLVKLYLDEPDSADVLAEVSRADAVATSVVAYAEARATFARRRRERLMTLAEAASARRRLNADWPRFAVIPVTAELGREAGRLADKHALRGFDAIHLATFEELLGRCEDGEVRFSCADERLVRAARSLG